jgi:2-methylfumaryl-CoA isomerase
MKVIEAASFIAGPSCGLHLAQFGAEVIRVDAIGGGPDFGRWPLSPEGSSFYWEGLNKGKKSVALDLGTPEGRELLVALATAPGDERGLFVTNFPASGFLAFDRLAARRADLIALRVMGRANGGSAVDYTVNSGVGLPYMTGPAELGETPVNHVLPAWDLLAGAYGAFALLAAERRRRMSGEGQEIRLPLDDLAVATLGHLGQIAETMVSGADRARSGNDLYGAFGRDFVTADGHRLMIVAITARQWAGLLDALGIAGEIGRLEQELGISLARDEGLRFTHRDRINPVVAAAVAQRGRDDLAAAMDRHGACWGDYRTLGAALQQDPTFTANPLLRSMTHPSGHTYPTPGAAATLPGQDRGMPGVAPRLGEHTDEVLADALGLSQQQIGQLHDRGVVAGP